MKTLLILGGTGIVGSATAAEAVSQGFRVTMTGIDRSSVVGVGFVHSDSLSNLAENQWDAIFDVYTSESFDAQKIYQIFRKKCGHLFVLSSTLVYDRSTLSYKPICSSYKKADLGTQGGYVDSKLRSESFWESVEDMNWTILRPYHIIGKGSYLGCLPPHNRNPDLIDHIRTGQIFLCDGGRNPINIVNARDIGKVVLKCIQKQNTFSKSYNVVNPAEIIARDYYLKIAEILGVELQIANLPGEQVWRSGDWKLTTLPHLYDVSDLERDCGYAPAIGLEESLREAVEFPPPHMEKNKTPVHKRMHILPEPQMNKYYE